jgi:hypothetical protein
MLAMPAGQGRDATDRALGPCKHADAATRLPPAQGVKDIIADPSKRNTNAVYKFETFTAANKPHGAAKAQAEDQEETTAEFEGRPHGRRSLLRRLRAN